MFNRIFQCSAVATAMLILGPASASATIFSGDPFADGWLAGGRSNHVGPDFGFPNGSFAGALPGLDPNLSVPGVEYQVYSQTTVLTPLLLSNLLMVCASQCSAWAVGDTIVGLGAVFPTAVNTTLPQYSPITLVVKWGVSASAYSLSNNFNSVGAHRDHDAGEGGVGSVLAEFNFGAAGNAPTAQFQWTGLLSQSLVGPFVAFRSIAATINTFQSFEAYLNVTRLNLANGSPLRLYDGNSIVGVRSYNFNVLFQETNALIAGTAVPEPSTGLLAAGALLASWIVRRRSNS